MGLQGKGSPRTWLLLGSGWQSRRIALLGRDLFVNWRPGGMLGRSCHTWAKQQGYRMHLSTHCAILVRTHVGCRHVPYAFSESRCCAVRIEGINESGVLLISVYLRTAQGPEQQLDILGAILELCVREGKQFLIAGDWQLTPEEVLKTGFVQACGGALLRTHHTTCWAGAKRELDFMIASRELALQCESIRVDALSTTRPHDVLRLAGGIPVSLGTAFSEWAQEVNAWRVQFGCRDRPARGRGPKVEWKRLDAMLQVARAPMATPWLCACRWLYARCLRLQSLGQRHWGPRVRVKGPAIRYKRVLEPLCVHGEQWTLAQLFTTLHTGGLLQVGILMSAVHALLREAEVQAAAARRASWKDWAKQACKGGASPVHRWLKGPVPVAPLPGEGEFGLVGEAALLKVATEWTSIWERHEAVELPSLSNMHPLPEIDMESFRQNLSTYGAHKRGGSEGHRP
eukprot:5051837-Amphidinium_carterae.2